MLKIDNLETDLADGVILCALLELISSKKLVGINSKPKIRVQKLENNGAALRFLKTEGIKLVAIGPEGTFLTSLPSLPSCPFFYSSFTLPLPFLDPSFTPLFPLNKLQVQDTRAEARKQRCCSPLPEDRGHQALGYWP
jgi:hypothetical protein